MTYIAILIGTGMALGLGLVKLNSFILVGSFFFFLFSSSSKFSSYIVATNSLFFPVAFSEICCNKSANKTNLRSNPVSIVLSIYP